MAAGSQELKGIWALLVKAPTQTKVRNRLEEKHSSL